MNMRYGRCILWQSHHEAYEFGHEADEFEQKHPPPKLSEDLLTYFDRDEILKGYHHEKHLWNKRKERFLVAKHRVALAIAKRK
jgi:hypothetical protein